MRTFSLDEAARFLKCSPRSLADRRYRERIGLDVRRVGRRLVVLENDLLRVLGIESAASEADTREAGTREVSSYER